MNGLGGRLRARARELNLTDSEVARRANVGQTRYANYVTGRHEPDLATLARICGVLGVSPSQLLGWPPAGTDEAAPLRERVAAAMEALGPAPLAVLATVADGLVATAAGPVPVERPPRRAPGRKKAVPGG